MIIEEASAELDRRQNRWRYLLREWGADQTAGEVRARLLLWRSGKGSNSIVVDTLHPTPLPIREALWRLNDRFEMIMALESARVNVPAPIPPSLGRTIPPGIDTAGLYIWDGFVNPSQDTWSGLLWWATAESSIGRRPLIGDDEELRAAIMAYQTGMP